jgi:hypothetical protein
MPIERRIREGAERNAGVLDPDVDGFLDSVVRRTRRRQVVRRSLTVVASIAAVVLAVVVGPSVLDDIRDSGGTVPGGDTTTSVAPSVVPAVPLLTGTFTRTIPEGTAVVRANGLAGTWTIEADPDGSVRLLAPSAFPGAHASQPFDMQPDGLSTDAFGSDMCAGSPAGSYRWTVSGDFLLLSVVTDQCDARVVVLGARPWKVSS